MRKALVFALCLITRSTESYERERLVMWNVGQGSWATFISTTACDHFDVGGEKPVPSQLMHYCFGRRNHLYLSHSDWDHISHLKDIFRSWKGFCLAELPRDMKLKSPKTRLFFNRIKICANTRKSDSQIAEIATSFAFKRANDLSRIFTFQKRWLFPGDSTSAAEKQWAPKLRNIPIEILIVGHHGSRTSTSLHLLAELPSLRLAVASSRYRKYGHPHAEVRRRLQLKNIPLLTTEDWGHLIFEM